MLNGIEYLTKRKPKFVKHIEYILMRNSIQYFHTAGHLNKYGYTLWKISNYIYKNSLLSQFIQPIKKHILNNTV